MVEVAHTLAQTGIVAVEGGDILFRLYRPNDKTKAESTPLIVVHGGPGCSQGLMYDALKDLANETPILFYDQLGSPLSPGNFTKDLAHLGRFTDEITRLSSYLNVDHFNLLGHSWGGAVAAAFAIQNPNRVERLILSSPLLSTHKWIADCHQLLRQLPVDFDAVLACEKEGRTNDKIYQKANELFMAQHGCRIAEKPDFFMAHRGEWAIDVYNIMWGPSEFSCTGTLQNLDLFPDLSKITASTLIICGAYDSATPKTMQEAQEQIAEATLTVIPDCAHLCFVDNNRAYLTAVTKHLMQ